MKTTIHQTIRFVVSTALVLGTNPTFAQNGPVTQAYCSPDGTTGGFTDSDTVTNGGMLKLNGAAKITTDGKLQLTDSKLAQSQASNVYFRDAVDFSYVEGTTNRPFHVYFSFTIGPDAGDNGGAGLSFLMQNNDVGQTGASGAGLGYAGISTSLAIEFDTRKDIPPMGNALYPDPSGDHIGFMLDGKHEEHPAFILPESGGFTSLTKQRMFVWIDYPGMGDQNMRLYMSPTKQKPKMPLVWQLNQNPVPMLPFPAYPNTFDTADWFSVEMDDKPAEAWVGFSASTHSATITNDHVIEEWEFSNEGVPCACQETEYCANIDPTTPVCDARGSGVCVECLDNEQCGSKNPTCERTTNTCVHCKTNADCNRFPETPVCDVDADSPTKGECIACPTGTKYQSATEQCVPDDGPGSGSEDDIGAIAGGGFSCTVSTFAPNDDLRTVLPFLFGAGLIVARRRRRA